MSAVRCDIELCKYLLCFDEHLPLSMLSLQFCAQCRQMRAMQWPPSRCHRFFDTGKMNPGLQSHALSLLDDFEIDRVRVAQFRCSSLDDGE